jgi:predicted Zn-ribbon and HTH transcriptional regulator
MVNSNSWLTRRQKLIKLLKEYRFSIDLGNLMRELEYSNKKILNNDIMSISKTLKNEGLELIISPSLCNNFGFVFKNKKNSLKIPTKCPKCREQRIEWPFIRIK